MNHILQIFLNREEIHETLVRLLWLSQKMIQKYLNQMRSFVVSV